MAVDFSQFVTQAPDWAGLYKAGDTLERRRVRDDQQAQQMQARKHASAQALQNYLDPKEYMTGTAYDPMIVKGLQDAMDQGMALASKGVDTPTMYMALGPLVKKLSDYSTRAKTLNTQMDEQIKMMQQSHLNGYDYAALKREAMNSAMFNTDPQTGKATLDPNKADPGIDWIGKTIADKPEAVTTNAALDEFAKKSPMLKDLHKVDRYDMKGELNSQKYHTIGQGWLQAEFDKEGRPTGMVPKYQTATSDGKPLMHSFTDDSGKTTEAAVRLFDEKEFDALPDPVINRFKGLTKEAIKNYKIDGKSIDLGDPRAKLVSRAIAYDELNRRKTTTIENAGVENKPSSAQINLNVQSSPEYLELVKDKAAAAKEGRNSVMSDAEAAKAAKLNSGQTIGKIFKNDKEFLQGQETEITGTIKEYGTDQKRNAGKIKAIDVTSAFPGGGLKANNAEGFDFKKIYYDPKSRSLIVQKESGKDSKKKTEQELVPEAKVGQFIRQIAEANGIPTSTVRGLLDEMGYKDGKFSGVDQDYLLEKELQEREKKKRITKSIFTIGPEPGKK
jgi:hypothetical protein